MGHYPLPFCVVVGGNASLRLGKHSPLRRGHSLRSLATQIRIDFPPLFLKQFDFPSQKECPFLLWLHLWPFTTDRNRQFTIRAFASLYHTII